MIGIILKVLRVMQVRYINKTLETSIIKKRDEQFTKDHIMGIYENGKIVNVWNNGLICTYLLNLDHRTIEKIQSNLLSDVA